MIQSPGPGARPSTKSLFDTIFGYSALSVLLHDLCELYKI